MRNNQKRLRAASKPVAQTNSQTIVDSAYAVPTEFVVLPSKGKFYTDDHLLSGEETIEIRYMTAKDEDILASTALIEKGIVIDRLFESIIVPDVDPSSLLIGDRNAIMVAARISSYGAGYRANVKCPVCFDDVEYLFDLEKINLTENCFDETFLAENNIDFNDEEKIFEFSLPKSKVKIGIKLFCGADEKTLNDLDDSKLITSALSSFVVSVDDNMDAEAVQNFIECMPAGDSRYIRTLFPKLAPNIDLKQEFTCENCVNQCDMEVPLTAEFFWPG